MQWTEEHDYLVIGAGSAGCVVAARLAEDPSRSVLVLEAGGSDRDPRIALPGAQAFLIGSRHDWKFWTEPQPAAAGRRFYLPRGRALGGSGSINTSIYIRGHARDYDEWAAQGNSDWDYAACLPFFRRSEHNTRGADAFHGVDGPLWVSDPEAPNELSQRFVQAAASAGLAPNRDFNGTQQAGAGLYQLNHKRGRRFSPADAFLRPALARGNPRAITGALVHRLVIEDGRAVGALYERHGQLRAVRVRRELVLCAGAIGSPHLLMLSGLGPADHLRQHGVPVVADLPGVGENFQDHVHAPIVMAAPPGLGLVMPATARQWMEMLLDVGRYVRARRGTLASNLAEAGGFLPLAGDRDRPSIQLHFAPAYGAPPPDYATPGVWGYTVLPCLLRPESRGQLRLRSADPRHPPCIDPRFFSAEADARKLARGLERAREIAHDRAFGPAPRELVPGPGADLERHARGHSWSVHHAAGTCRMGRDARAVVDDRLRVRGVEGLRVADCSIMPTIVGGNTNAPAVMIGERAAAWIAQR